MVPALVAAATLTMLQGRPPWTVLLWGSFLAASVLIVVIRKHERFLLHSFKEQSTWLMLNEKKITELAKSGPTGSEWM